MTYPSLVRGPLGLRTVVLLVAMSAAQVWAVINVGLQPYDLYQSRYDHVAVLRIESVDKGSGRVKCRILKSLKGTLTPGQAVDVRFAGSMAQVLVEAVGDKDIQTGDPMVVFAGRRRKAQDLMVYANAFYLGTQDAPGAWTLDRSSETLVGLDGEQISTLAGTWNGTTGQLVALVEDIAAGRDHFPRKAYARFRPDKVLDKLDAPVQGLAVYDIEGDGDLDIVACASTGSRVYLQTDPMVFANATTVLGLDAKGTCCSLADLNADGLTDLLIGNTLFLGRFADNRFRFENLGPLAADLADRSPKSAAFAELDGDGLPDVVASEAGRGLRAFRNTGKQAFEEVTKAMGLDRPECGARGNGYFSVGDWNGDLRMDLFYAVGKGLLLVQNEQGVYKPVDHAIEFRFASGPDGLPGRTGAGVFMPLLGPDRMDLVVPIDDGWLTIANQDGRPVDVTRWGNEISEGSSNHLATIAEDLNIDGHVDFYTISDAPNGHNRYIINRGYGSFMLAPVHKHFDTMFDGPASELGGTSVACGDLDDDGAGDLVVGNSHGQVTLFQNDTWAALHEPVEHPPREVAALQQVRLITVRVLGSKGVVNARVRLEDAAGRVVARRDLGTNVANGCGGPSIVTLAVRKPGKYRVAVEYADGLKRTGEAIVTENPKVLVNVDRGERPDHGVW